MKKFISFIAIVSLLFYFSFSSCTKDESKDAAANITKAVTGLSFPQQLKDGSSLTACSFDNNVLTFVCEVDAKRFKNIETENLKSHTTQQLKTGLFPRQLINQVVKAKATIKYVYVNGSDSISYEIPANELEDK